MTKSFFRLPAMLLTLLVAACHPPAPPQPTAVKIGKPYVINGKTYFPEYDPTYDKIGTASWYGPGFHGRYTASGERFDQHDLTAAHPTLPMPSIVRVTNLSNGRSLLVRINDRGPFKSDRIIDLSEQSAKELGIRTKAEVRVQYLKDETDQYIASWQNTGNRPKEMAELNSQVESAKDASIIQSTEPSDQIVEANNNITRSGQIVSASAPVATVTSGELRKPSTAETATVAKPVILIGAGDQAVDDAAPSSVSAAFATKEAPPVTIAPADHPTPAAPLVLNTPFQKASLAKPANKERTDSMYIQAGSFSTEANARKLSATLATVGPNDVGKVSAGEKTWWRVRVGPFYDAAMAESALGQVRRFNLPDARIVQQ